jgi:RHH-type proline utilization regulon transcriptional repressor/proline dehydrogenase/delta 1-pyrroline-5-carboxylate dehydrogenase
LLADPVAEARALEPVGLPHPRIDLPRDLFGHERANSSGLDLTNEQRLAGLAAALGASAAEPWRAVPLLGDGRREGAGREVRNPATATTWWASSSRRRPPRSMPPQRAPRRGRHRPKRAPPALRRVADRLEARAPALIGLMVREAGKTFANAVGEVREAVDFLRYYASQIRGFANDTHRPLGTVACISPWKLPAVDLHRPDRPPLSPPAMR